MHIISLTQTPSTRYTCRRLTIPKILHTRTSKMALIFGRIIIKKILHSPKYLKTFDPGLGSKIVTLLAFLSLNLLAVLGFGLGRFGVFLHNELVQNCHHFGSEAFVLATCVKDQVEDLLEYFYSGFLQFFAIYSD